MLSYSGAKKLNIDNNFSNPSDQYTRKLTIGEITKPGVDNFNAFFANYNFSLKSEKFYGGDNPNSLSTKMGCRHTHKISYVDCTDSTIYSTNLKAPC